MSDRRPIEAEYHAGEGGDEEEAPVSEEELKEALSFHAGGVTIVAVRDGSTVYGTTVTSFAPVSLDPAVVMVAVGGNAQVLPFLEEGVAFVVNLLRGDQKRLATVYADSYPVGPSPFPDEGQPVIEDALAHLRCQVESVVPVGGGRVVLGRVVATGTGDGEETLIHYRREYHTLP